MIKRSLLILLICLPALISSYAQQSGTTGPLTWTLDTEGTLTISGEGDMPDYAINGSGPDIPWIGYRSRIVKVNIGNLVTTIGNYAFYNCTELKELIIPNSITSIGENTCYACYSLNNLKVGNSVKVIKMNAFRHCYDLINLEIGNSVKTIERYAFLGCTKLTELILPNSVTHIGESAFSGCTKITKLTFGDSITDIDDSAFMSCSGLTELVIPNSVITIKGRAFSNCHGLTKISIGNSVTTIGAHAFISCARLTEFNIPSSVTNIGEWAFAYCGNLKTISVASDNPYYSSHDGILFNKEKTSLIQYPAQKQGSYSIPATVTEIAAGAFLQCPKVTELLIPNSVKTIGGMAFDGCQSLEAITVASDNYNYSSIDGVLFNKGKTLLIRCPIKRQGNYSIPMSVTNIESGSFSDCHGITNLIIPNLVTNIGGNAFYGCKSLSTIYCLNPIPAKIDSHAFYGIDKNQCILYVPEGSASAYKEEYVWMEFLNIREGAPSRLDSNTAPQFSLYPNPAKDFVVIQSDYSVDKVEIYNQSGACVKTEVNPADKIVISDLTPGVYLLRTYMEGKTNSRKLVIE